MLNTALQWKPACGYQIDDKNGMLHESLPHTSSLAHGIHDLMVVIHKIKV